MELSIRITAEDIKALNELEKLSQVKYMELLQAMPDDPYEWDAELETRMAIWGRRIQFLEKIQKGIDEQMEKRIRKEAVEWQDDGQC